MKRSPQSRTIDAPTVTTYRSLGRPQLRDGFGSVGSHEKLTMNNFGSGCGARRESPPAALCVQWQRSGHRGGHQPRWV